MATVLIEGMFMNAELKTTTYEGVEKTALHVDVYQKDSESRDKLVNLKTAELALFTTLNQDYDFGSMITVKAVVNAYKNEAYFKLVEIVEAS